MLPIDHFENQPRSGGAKTEDSEFGRLVRLAVKAYSGYTGRDIAAIEEELAQEIGINARSFANFYKGRAHIDVRVIKILLNLGKQCRYLNRSWGEDLLRAGHYARYGDPAAVLDQYWPPDPTRPLLPPRVFSNLPAPTYCSFVMRSTPYTAVAEALSARTPLVVIVGLGGMGKTSLTREIAGQCIDLNRSASADQLPHVDVVVWISDKDNPGTTRLNTVLDTIAITMDFPELTRFDMVRRQHEVDQLLRNRRVLLVIDNLETMSDPALLSWLLRLPEPSKAIVTTREYQSAFENRGVWRIDLERMSEREGREFIALQYKKLKLASALDAAVQQELLSATGGNPKALEILLGLSKRMGRPVQQVLRGETGNAVMALESLTATSWAQLNPTERQIMVALTLFPASADDTAVASVAGIDSAPFYDAIQQLSDLALVETEQTGTGKLAVRRALHPVTRQFVEAHLNDDAMFAAAVRARRIAWAVEYTMTYGGHRPNELEALRWIEAEELNLWETLTWASRHGYDRETVTLAHQLEFYYYTRALWAKKKTLHQHYIAAARRLGDREEQINALALQIQLLSRQGHPEDTQDELAELLMLTRRGPLQGASFFNAKHAEALASMARGKLEAAAAAWQQIIDQREARAVPERLIIGTLHWLALCRYRQGEQSEAQMLLARSLELARAQGNLRRAARNEIALALIELDLGQIDKAHTHLASGHVLAEDFDREQRAHYQHALGRLRAVEGDVHSARHMLQEALELFERMGLEQEMRELRAELAGIGILSR